MVVVALVLSNRFTEVGGQITIVELDPDPGDTLILGCGFTATVMVALPASGQLGMFSYDDVEQLLSRVQSRSGRREHIYLWQERQTLACP